MLSILRRTWAGLTATEYEIAGSFDTRGARAKAVLLFLVSTRRELRAHSTSNPPSRVVERSWPRWTHPRLVRLGLFDRIGGGLRRDRAIETRNYRLDKCVAQHLGERLPGAYIRTRQFSLEVDVGRYLFGAANS